jgi:hypothetical protein
MISPLKKPADEELLLNKADANTPALLVTGPRTIAIKAMTVFRGRTLAKDTPLTFAGDLEPGADYGVSLVDGVLTAEKLKAAPGQIYIGGFHFAPGGNAPAREGGDSEPAINPCSVWDIKFKPACPDPRGMAMVEGPRGLFWCDIYLTCADHLVDGTSSFGKTIADGASPPQNPAGGRFANFDYETAVAVLAHHGKQVLALDEFFAAAYGVTEKTARGRDPRTTGLDAARTSKHGIMQATGNLWVWGHDGDPDMPRASLFGGSWLGGDSAGSRCASVGYWPGHSYGHLGARGRCDHLQLV